MKTLLTLALSLSVGLISHAQSYSWSQAYGNMAYDLDPKLAVDPEGNLYTAGFFTGTVDFDPGPGTATLTSGTSGFAADAYITKFDTAGNFIWVKHIIPGPNHIVYAYDIVFDPSGFFYITGYFEGTVDFDPGPNTNNLVSTASSNDTYILKLDTDGNFVWAVNIGAGGQEYGKAITLDTSGNVLLTGLFSGTADFDPGPGQTIFMAQDGADAYVAKYTSDGDMIWAKQIEGNFEIDARDIKVDKTNQIYITGFFDGHRDFDPGLDSMILTSVGYWDAYLLKLDASGNFEWVRRLGNDNDNWGNKIAFDTANNVLLTGHFSGAIDFDPGPESYILTAINADIYVWKLDPTGQLIWVDQLGGISYERGNAIEVDKFGNIYLTGFYAETVDFDPGPGVYNLTCTGDNDENDVFVCKLHSDGSFAWAQTLGGLANDSGGDLLLGRYNDIYLTGLFETTAGFNPGSGLADSLVSLGSFDVYLVRWTECEETYSELSPFSCNTYTSPSGRYTWTVSGTYLDTIANHGGCDSIMTIHLLISDLGLFITQSGNDLIGDGGAGQFTWLDCDHNYEIVGEGNVFTPAMNGNYALTGSGIICTDTSDCFSFVMTGTEDHQVEQEISVFPNPTLHSFNIDLRQSFQQVDITMYDQLGRKVYAHRFSNLKIISISPELPAGLYLVVVEVAGQRQLKKIMML